MGSTTYSRFMVACGRFAPDVASRGERTGILQPRRPPRQKVGLERHNHIGLLEMINRLELFAEGQPRARRIASRDSGSYACHFACGKLLEQSSKLIGQSRRGHGLGQDPQAGPLARAQRFSRLSSRSALEVLPRLDPPVARDQLRAVGVVERRIAA